MQGLEHIRETMIMIAPKVHSNALRDTIAEAFLPLCKSLIVQLGELRSAIINEVCAAIAAMAEALGDSFDPIGAKLVPALLDLSGRGKKVMSDYGSNTLNSIVQHCQGLAIIGAVLKAAAATKPKPPSPPVVMQCAKFVRLALEQWPAEQLIPVREEIAQQVSTSLAAKSAEARADGRKAYLAFWQAWPVEGDALIATFDTSAQRALQKEFSQLPGGDVAGAGTSKCATNSALAARRQQTRKWKQVAMAKAAATEESSDSDILSDCKDQSRVADTNCLRDTSTVNSEMNTNEATIPGQASTPKPESNTNDGEGDRPSDTSLVSKELEQQHSTSTESQVEPTNAVEQRTEESGKASSVAPPVPDTVKFSALEV